MFAPEIGGRISPDTGNPQILAIDNKTGIVVSIEVDSQYWKSVLGKLGQLRGVGILPGNMKSIIETGHPNGEN